MPKSKKNLYILAACSLLLIVTAIYFLFVFQKAPKSMKVDRSNFEVKSVTDVEVAKRPFITMTPTATGAEIIISIENMAEFDNIEYELTYMADNPQIPNEKIQRGSTGTDVNTKEPKYKKSMLLGTASRGVSNPDTGISDGKLTLHLFKGNVEYQSETPWYLLQAGLETTNITNPDGTINIELPKLTKDYYLILSETVGVPPSTEYDLTKVELPVYGAFSTMPKFPKPAELSLNVKSENPALFLYDNQIGEAGNHDSTTADGTLTSEIEFLSTFVVVSQQ